MTEKTKSVRQQTKEVIDKVFKDIDKMTDDEFTEAIEKAKKTPGWGRLIVELWDIGTEGI